MTHIFTENNDSGIALKNLIKTSIQNLEPMARVVAMTTAGVAPRIMGIGPVPASRKVLELAGLKMDQMDVIELNEAFSAQSLACLRELGLADDAGGGGLGHKYLAPVSDAHDPGCPVDFGTVIVTRTRLALAGVQTHADPQHHRIRPRLRGQRDLCLDRRSHRIGGPRERRTDSGRGT